ncbi:MAG: DUF4397 domain-containing protein [Kangiellaceae bacterium]|jgi:hypothetical protein|nr:DUF4397 domain-containing protein [Kangiellaceae bacterium]
MFSRKFTSLSQGLKLLTAAAFGLFLVGCDDDDDSAPRSADPKVQVVHASPDAPAVNLFAAGASLAENVDYAQATARLQVTAGTLNVDVQAILPDGTTPSVIGPVDLELEGDTQYTVLAVNDVTEIAPLIITRDDVEVSEGFVRATVLHAAPDAPQVDVYVTAPGADLADASPLGSIVYQETLGPVEVEGGNYQVRVAVAGTTTVVYDSGTIPLPAGADLTIVAIENTLTGDAPINLLALDDNGGSIIQDVNATADLRVVHASPDAPAVDVVVNDGFQAPLVEDLAFAEATDFVGVPSDTYNVKVVPANATTPVVIDADLALEQGVNYSVLAVDVLANIEPLVLVEDRREVATEAKLQVVHASPAAQTVDVYLTAVGADITNLDPTIPGFQFKDTTDGFLSVPAGQYDVTVTGTGSKDPAIGPATLTLEAGGIYTIVARDGDQGAAPTVLLLDDF